MDTSRSDQGAGGAEGASSNERPSSEEPTQEAGDVAIPIGVPVSEEEFRRLKEAARRQEESEEPTDDQAQQDVDGDEEN